MNLFYDLPRDLQQEILRIHLHSLREGPKHLLLDNRSFYSFNYTKTDGWTSCTPCRLTWTPYSVKIGFMAFVVGVISHPPSPDLSGV